MVLYISEQSIVEELRSSCKISLYLTIVMLVVVLRMWWLMERGTHCCKCAKKKKELKARETAGIYIKDDCSDDSLSCRVSIKA